VRKVKILNYVARQSSPFKKEHAQVIGEFLDEIEVKTTRNILSRIKKNRKHIIASYIEWDNNKAAEEHRLQQVRNIVNHVLVVIVNKDVQEEVRAFYPVSTNETKEVYADIVEAFSDKDIRKQIVSRAKNELANWSDRYRQYKELSDFVKFIDKRLK